MMSHLLCHLLLLVFLSSGAIVLTEATNNEIKCGYDNFCQATLKLMTAVKEMKNQLDELATNEKEKLDKLAANVNEKFDKLAVNVNEKLDRLSTNENEKFDKLAKNVSEKLDKLSRNENEKLDKLATNVDKKLDKLAANVDKKLDKLATNLNEKLDKLATYVDEKLDKLAANVDEKLDKLATNLNEKLDKLATNVNEKLDKQAHDLELLTMSMNKGFSSTAAIYTKLEKQSADLLNHDGRLKTHDVLQTKIYQLVQSIEGALFKPRDCSDVRARGNTVSGVYRLSPSGDMRGIEVDVYCDFRSAGQSWLVFQRRKDGSVNFDRNWNEYAIGFGALTGEFWIGNEKLSLLTTNRKYKLRIELEDFVGAKRWAEYSTFSVRASTDKYRLIVGGYSGNAGDSFAGHNNMLFTTRDADNDQAVRNCAQMYPGGWWFHNCHRANLNGRYLRGSHTQIYNGVCWFEWKGFYYSLKTTEMKIAAVI